MASEAFGGLMNGNSDENGGAYYHVDEEVDEMEIIRRKLLDDSVSIER